MSQNLPAFSFEWVKDTFQFNEDLIKNYDEQREIGYILKVDVKYPKELHKSHNDLPFLPERKKLATVEKLVTSLENKSECYSHKKFEIGLRPWSSSEKVHKVIIFNQDEWLKP